MESKQVTENARKFYRDGKDECIHIDDIDKFFDTLEKISEDQDLRSFLMYYLLKNGTNLQWINISDLKTFCDDYEAGGDFDDDFDNDFDNEDNEWMRDDKLIDNF